MPDSRIFDLQITFPASTPVELPHGTVIDLPQPGRAPFPLAGDGLQVVFPSGSGIIIPGGDSVTVELPHQNKAFDLSATVEGHVTVTLPSGESRTIQPAVDLADVVPEVSQPPFQLPGGAFISLSPQGPTIELPVPTTVSVPRSTSC